MFYFLVSVFSTLFTYVLGLIAFILGACLIVWLIYIILLGVGVSLSNLCELDKSNHQLDYKVFRVKKKTTNSEEYYSEEDEKIEKARF